MRKPCGSILLWAWLMDGPTSYLVWPNTALSSDDFDPITSAGTMRRIQFGLRFTF